MVPTEEDGGYTSIRADILSERLCSYMYIGKCMVMTPAFLGVWGGSGGSAGSIGIRNLSLQGEKLSADLAQVNSLFGTFMNERQLSLQRVFNCDEAGLNFHLLPDKTLAGTFEKSADGRKASKERVTVNVCSNATGTVKLPLQLIGKVKKPCCFKHVNMELLPVQYHGQSNAWMSCEIFSEWFHDSLVPIVHKELDLQT